MCLKCVERGLFNNISKRKLARAESSVAMVTECLSQNEGLFEELTEQRKAKETAEENLKDLQEERDDLKIQVDNITKAHKEAIDELNKVNIKFNPLKDDLDRYQEEFETQQAIATHLQKKFEKAQTKLGNLSTRNVNKRIRTRERHLADVQSDKEKLQDANQNLCTVLNSLKEELLESDAKMKETTKQRDQLQARLAEKTTQKRTLGKTNWRLNKKRKISESEEMYTANDMQALDDRIEVLQERNQELNDVIAMMESEEIMTFRDGKYTDDVRETIMALLAMNVATSKVDKVIRVVLRKLANKTVKNLPSVGTISEIRLEARHLADIEVGLAMRKNRPEEALGNCIHGDGTTKYHKKYQNFQVTLQDGSSRTIGLTQMAAADTDAVVHAYQDRIRELANSVSSVDDDNSEDVYKELLCTVKSAMTDQGPTMPQFGDKLQSIRQNLLPNVIQNWEAIPDDIKEGMCEFGQFYCKMHPLINFAEECNKILKSFEDITTSGKNAHTFTTSEAGATRLIRTASKAFHHRSSDQSGAEDAFTTYLQYTYNTPNKLVNYIGNRANILFEGASTTFYHLDHIVNFVSGLPDANNLLLAVSEDASEKIHRAELQALGIVHACITNPLWITTQGAENVLALNKPLHYLQQKLIAWKEDSSPLLDGDMGVEGMKRADDEITEALFADFQDPQLYVMTRQALELLCCGILLILERQCKDQLPGGKYWDLDISTASKFTNVPATNVIGERDFAWLDFLVRQKPSARTITLETIIMWVNNGTMEWLDNLEPGTKSRYMESARSHAPEILQKYREKMQNIKRQRWEQLQQKQRDKVAKEKKQLASKVKLTNEVTKQGGVWTTEETINNKYEEINNTMSDEEVRRAIYTQLSFHQKVLKSTVNKKEVFQLTTTVDGKQRKFTKQQMKEHLIQVVTGNDLETIDLEPDEPPPAVQYTDADTQLQKYRELKEALAVKMSDERKKRAIKLQRNTWTSSRTSLISLLINKYSINVSTPMGFSGGSVQLSLQLNHMTVLIRDKLFQKHSTPFITKKIS